MLKNLETRLVASFTFLIIVFSLVFILNINKSCIEDGSPFFVCLFVVLTSSFCYILSTIGIAFLLKKNPAEDLIRDAKIKFNYFNFFISPFLAELNARLFFLGILYNSSNNSLSFLIFLFGGNILWLFFENKYFSNTPKQPLEYIPSFISGLFFSYVYLKYGLFASYLTHLGSQSLLLTLDKIEDDNKEENQRIFFWSIFYLIPCAIYSYFYVNPFSFLALGTFEECGFLNYFVASVFVTYSLNMISVVIYFDRSSVKLNGDPIGAEPYEVVLGYFGLIIILLAFYYLLTCDILYSTLLLTMVLSAFYKPTSGSGRVRHFWFNFVFIFMAVGIMQSFGFFLFLLYLLLHTLLKLPMAVVEGGKDV